MRLPARIAAAAALLLPATAQAQSDPAGSGPIVAALAWLQGTLLGTVATAVAVMAVAATQWWGTYYWAGDADRADELALRRNRDHRLLHPVRRRLDRRRHPVRRGGGLTRWS